MHTPHLPLLRLLETIDTFSSQVNLTTGSSAQIVRTRLAVHVEEVNIFSFTGQTFIVDADLNSLREGSFQGDDIETNTGAPSSDDTASLFLPPETFDNVTNISDARLVFAVFADDNLFQPRSHPDDNQNRRPISGSLILTASVSGYIIEGLSEPVRIRFEKILVSKQWL